MLKLLWVFLGVGIVALPLAIFTAKYEAVKKYYPNLTVWEYVLLEDRLRITPEGN
jgi:hypothetical protein